MANFFAEHGDVAGLGKFLSMNGDLFRGQSQEFLALFCLLRFQIDHDPGRAREILDQLPAESIGDGDLSFELAILAFRLGDFTRAEAAARHALRLKPDWPVAENAVLMFRSFAGRDAPDMKPMRIRIDAANAVQAEGSRTQSDRYAWGIVCESGEGEVETRTELFGPQGERILEIPESANVVATFSILPSKQAAGHRHGDGRADPLEVLSYLDWNVPHLMLQRENRTALHAFVDASGHREWYWQEVSLELAYSGAGQPGKTSEGGRVWEAVLDELDNREQEDTV